MTLTGRYRNLARIWITSAVLCLAMGTTERADAGTIINIDDLSEGVPTISQTGTDVVSITLLNDSTNDFVHFRFLFAEANRNASFSSGLLESDSSLSDRILVNIFSNPAGADLFDVQFDSRDTILIPKGAIDFGNKPETRLLQDMFDTNAGVGLVINAASDVEGPEPASLILTGCGLIVLGLLARRQRSRCDF